MNRVLTFQTLSLANMARLPLFKNKHGDYAHREQDGHDWSPAQWFQALIGECGEFAQARLMYEAGELSYPDYCELAAKELADIQTYLSILCKRALDTTTTIPHDHSPAQILMGLIACLGDYANSRKKFERGDLNQNEFETAATQALGAADQVFDALTGDDDFEPKHFLGDTVLVPHPQGVDLAQVTISKFNEVSERVNAPVTIDPDGSCARVNGTIIRSEGAA